MSFLNNLMCFILNLRKMDKRQKGGDIDGK